MPIAAAGVGGASVNTAATVGAVRLTLPAFTVSATQPEVLIVKLCTSDTGLSHAALTTGAATSVVQGGGLKWFTLFHYSGTSYNPRIAFFGAVAPMGTAVTVTVDLNNTSSVIRSACAVVERYTGAYIPPVTPHPEFMGRGFSLPASSTDALKAPSCTVVTMKAGAMISYVSADPPKISGTPIYLSPGVQTANYSLTKGRYHFAQHPVGPVAKHTVGMTQPLQRATMMAIELRPTEIDVPTVEELEQANYGMLTVGLNVPTVEELEAVDRAAVVVGLPVATVDEVEQARFVDYDIVLPTVEEIEVVDAARKTAPMGYKPPPPDLPDLRVIAQDIVTRRWVHLDVPIAGLTVTRKLTAPREISGQLRPVLPELAGLGFEPWRTRLIVEDESGVVRATALLRPPFAVENDTRSVEAIGPMGYAALETWDGDYSSYSVDPLYLVRMMWAHILAKPGRQHLRMTVSAATSKVRVGGYPPAPSTGLTGPQIDPNASSGTAATDVKPYTLSWWEGRKIAPEIEELAEQVPFDYVEQSWWNAERSDVQDHLALGWPRWGRPRFDLRFAEGENIIDHIPVRRGTDDVADIVRVRGAGEGRAMVLGVASRPNPGRLPITVDIQDSTVRSAARAKARAEAELRRRTVGLAIERILVDARHPNAVWGSYEEGDDILVRVEIDWYGEVALWHRITEFAYTRDEEAVAILLQPSHIFRYGASD